MDRPTLNPRALEAYLRFSYPVGEPMLPGDAPFRYPEIRFSFDPERSKEDYLRDLNRLLDDMLEEER